MLCIIESPSPSTNGNFGSSFAAADFNADGKQELVVGESGASNSQGKVHIFRGTNIASGCAVTPLATSMATVAAASAENGAQFGLSLALGVLDGDAIPDLIIGEPFYAGGASQYHRGRIHVFKGAYDATNPVALTALYANAGVWLNGARSSPTALDGSEFGFAVTTVDLDNNGTDEIIVGEPNATNGANLGAGLVYAWQGSDGNTAVFSTSSISCGGGTAGGRCGFAVARGGRINQDGRLDLLVTELLTPTTARGRFFAYGLTGALGSAVTIIWNGIGAGVPEDNSLFGYSIANAGDIDGDGRADIVVGQPYGLASGVMRGRVYVYSGATGSVLLTINGTENYAELGRFVAGAGDINSDGYTDILFGEPSGQNGGPNRGRAYIYLAP